MTQRFLLVAAAALALCTGCVSQSAVRTPYLQSTTPSSVVIAFRLDQACAATVRYGVGERRQVVTSASKSEAHFVPLTGLQPGVAYAYEVEACGRPFAAPGTFRTAVATGTPQVRFAAMGDFGTGTVDQERVAESIRKRGADLVLGLGDIAYDEGSDDQFQEHFFAPMAPLLAEVPMFNVLGNHEYRTRSGQPYLDSLHLPANNPRGTERYYSFDWGHAHFVALDSTCALGRDGDGSCALPEQTAWLAQDLAKTQQPFKIVFLHHPLWSSGSHGSHPQLRQAWAPLFEQHGVDLVLTGHDHDYERSKPLKAGAVVPEGTPGAVTYLVVGTGSAPPRGFDESKPAWSAVRHGAALGYLDVTVAGGVLDARLVDPQGKELDHFRVEKALPTTDR